MADELVERGFSPGLVLSSDAMRTRETWERMAGAFDDVSVEFLPSLYHAGLEQIAAVIKGAPATVETVLVLGHNPGWEDAVDGLCGEYVRMTTGNVVVLERAGETWGEAIRVGRWRLVDVIRPRDL